MSSQPVLDYNNFTFEEYALWDGTAGLELRADLGGFDSVNVLSFGHEGDILIDLDLIVRSVSENREFLMRLA